MLDNTVAAYADELKKSSESLLEQLRRAGVAKDAASDTLTDADKQKLLAYLQASHGAPMPDRKKIILVKRSSAEIREADLGDPRRTIQVDVRGKRTFIKQHEAAPAVAEEAAASSLAAAAVAAVHSTLDLQAPEQQEVSDFVAELEAVLRDVSNAVEKSQQTSKDIGDLKERLQKRGWWDAVTANFGSSTQQELATQVLALSNSITVTQEFVRVMLKVQTQKDRVLHAFSDAVAQKIANVQADTKTLNGNQRIAALTLLGELRQQVDEQIRQRALVESHERLLQAMEQELIEAAQAQAETERELAHVQVRSAALEQRVDSIGKWQMGKDDRDGESARQMARMLADTAAIALRFSQLEAWKRDKEAGDLALRQQLLQSESQVAALKERIGGLEGRLSKLEAARLHGRSLGALIARQLPALIALGLAATAMFRTVGTP